MTFFEFNKKFPTEQSVIDYFIHIRYNDRLTCPPLQLCCPGVSLQKQGESY
jgi:hypothetical protein